MRENRITSAQFGFRTVWSEDPGRRGEFDDFPVVPDMEADAPESLQREAALLMAETGKDVFAISIRLGIGMEAVARLLAPHPWRYGLPEFPAEDGPTLPLRREQGPGGFTIRGREDRTLLKRVHSASMGREWVTVHRSDFPGINLARCFGRLVKGGFLRRNPERRDQVALTPSGEAAAILMKGRL